MLPAELAELLERLPLDPAGYQCVPRPLDGLLRHTRWGGSDRRNTVAQAEYRFLAALGASGWSMRQALLEAVAWDAAAGGPRVTRLDGVCCVAGGRPGWVLAELVELIGEIQTLPVH